MAVLPNLPFLLSVAARAHTSPLQYFRITPTRVMGDHCGFPCSGSRPCRRPVARFRDRTGRAWVGAVNGAVNNESRRRFPGRRPQEPSGPQWLQRKSASEPICKVSVRSLVRGHLCCPPAVALRPHRAHLPSRRPPAADLDARSVLARHTATTLGRIRIACTPGQRRSRPGWGP